jgi:hypothetical protein
MLKCEKNTPEMELRIKRAFEKMLGEPNPHDTVDLVFEHGQWWVIHTPEENDSLQYSVVDAHGLHTFDGFDFELVS